MVCKTNRVSAICIESNMMEFNLKNSICEFKDIEFTDDLYIKVEGTSLDLGTIEHVNKYYRGEKEYWDIYTVTTYVKLQILSKPEWMPVETKDAFESDVSKFEAKRIIKNIENAIDKYADWLEEVMIYGF